MAPPAFDGPRVDILGVHLSAVNMASALEEITRWVESGEAQYLCVTGVHGVMASQPDERLRVIHNSSGLTVPDGMPMVWLGRRAGAHWMERVCGPDLMLAVCELAAQRGWTSYFYGGGPGVADRLVDELTKRFPGLITVGTYTPPFRPLESSEAAEVAKRINEAAPDLIWVGLSTPKQERWMAEFRPVLSAPAIFGVGAAFDLHAGLTTRAPVWMQRSGLEWLYRLLREPKRLWRRYLTNNPRFIMKVARRPPVLLGSTPHETERPRPARGKFVVLVGPDGAGKTTLARNLLDTMRGRYFHFRPPLLPTRMLRVPPPLETSRKKEDRATPIVVGWLRLARNFIGSWVAYMTSIRPSLKRGDIVIGDRWMYGYIVQPGPLRYAGPEWLARLAINLLPRPDIVVNVMAPSEVIHTRKNELDERAIHSELQAWARLPVPNLVSVENTDDPHEAVTQISRYLSRTKPR